MRITNQRVTGHPFLRGLYDDGNVPDHLVDRGRVILLRLCARIEAEPPADTAALYRLTHAAAEEFNALRAEFEAAGSGWESAARQEIGGEFRFVAQAYGFTAADAEELVAPRVW